MTQVQYNFKRIQTVPTSKEFVDIVLSKTQRKTPTVVHPGYNIGRIRKFYMRKVKYTQDTFEEKLGQIITDFPQLDNIHPFYGDLLNVLYDKDHYKLALGQINTARQLINKVARDYVRLLKFGDSLYRCKLLKRAALGRMATIMSRQKDSLGYLEQVRQHLGRLPSIDTGSRTLLVCGYPNVGKSSFMNKVTRAEVEVQPYAFTTKSLFVGHMDYKYLRWQVIDTPGILDHPLEERNTIEMQSITALAHLRACVLFFMDLSEQCGYSLAEQIGLFESIQPLFGNRPTVLVMTKSDLKQLEDVEDEKFREKIEGLLAASNGKLKLSKMSTFLDEGVMETRNLACEMLLAYRVENKLRSISSAAAAGGDASGSNNILNKINLSEPKQRDDVVRMPNIPEKVIAARTKMKIEQERKEGEGEEYMQEEETKRILEKDLEVLNGGAGVYNVDLKKHYKLEDEEWKYDVIPEIMDGKNIADFIDPEIEYKLAQLELEEEQYEAEGIYDEEKSEFSDEEEQKAHEDRRKLAQLASKIRKQKQIIIQQNRLKPKFNALAKARKIAGVNSGANANKSQDDKNADSMDVESVNINKNGKRLLGASMSVSGQSQRRDRSTLGLRDSSMLSDANKKKFLTERRFNLDARRGEADRQIQVKRPKHLYSGKRKNGSTDYR